MKFYIKLLITVVVIFAVVLPLVVKGPDGQPIMRIGEWLPGSVDDVVGSIRSTLKSGGTLNQDKWDNIAEQAATTISTVKGAKKQTENSASKAVADSPVNLSSSSGKMYKWQDENGRWHFSTQKPANQQQISIEALPEVENLMQPPVNEEENSSTIGLPGIGDAGELLKKMQRMSADKKE